MLAKEYANTATVMVNADKDGNAKFASDGRTLVSGSPKVMLGGVLFPIATVSRAAEMSLKISRELSMELELEAPQDICDTTLVKLWGPVLYNKSAFVQSTDNENTHGDNGFIQPAKAGYRQFESWLVQQGPNTIRTLYGQADCNQVDRSISLGATSKSDFSCYYC